MVVSSEAFQPARQVFISHAHVDSAVAEWAADQVRAVGLRPYLAGVDAQPGQTLGAKVRSEIKGSEAVLVILTDDGASSRYVEQEIGAALACGHRVIALVVESVAETSLAMLDGVEHIRFDPSDLSAVSAKLTSALREIADQRRSDSVLSRVVALAPGPALAVQAKAELNLTAGHILVGAIVGAIVLLACAVCIYYVLTRVTDS